MNSPLTALQLSHRNKTTKKAVDSLFGDKKMVYCHSFCEANVLCMCVFHILSRYTCVVHFFFRLRPWVLSPAVDNLLLNHWYSPFIKYSRVWSLDCWTRLCKFVCRGKDREIFSSSSSFSLNCVNCLKLVETKRFILFRIIASHQNYTSLSRF